MKQDSSISCILSQGVILLYLFHMRHIDPKIHLVFMQTSIIFIFYKCRSFDILRYATFTRILLYRRYLALTSVVLLANCTILIDLLSTTIIGKRFVFLLYATKKQHMCVCHIMILYSIVSGLCRFDFSQCWLSVLLILTNPY